VAGRERRILQSAEGGTSSWGDAAPADLFQKKEVDKAWIARDTSNIFDT